MYSGIIPELSDAWYELSNRYKRHRFRDHLELVSRQVAKWPAWKKNVLGRVVPDELKPEPTPVPVVVPKPELSHEQKLAELFGITLEEAAMLSAWYD